MPMDPKAPADAALATGLVTAPAWAAWLAEFNAVLTTLSLLAGLALVIVRIWAHFSKKNPPSG